MGLLMLSTALDYAYGFWVASPNRKKAKLFLWLSVFNNLGILGVFKYYNRYDDIDVETIYIHFNYDLYYVDKSLAMRHSECMQSLLSNQRFRLARHSSIHFFKVKRGSQLFPHKRDISNDVNLVTDISLFTMSISKILTISISKK